MNATDFLKAAIDSGIVSPEFLASYAAAATVESDAESLSGRLVDEGRMTAFQSQRIRDGKADELTIGPYVLMELLGQGGMGTVYKAQHRTMRRLVALKVITEAGLKSPDAIRRFAREAEAAARLDHPNIVAAYDAGEADGDHYLVMQFVEGRSLQEIIKEEGPQPPRRAIDWVLQATHGLAYAHGRGVIHRDIKPGNLLLDRDGSVKILDMGLARLESLGEDQDQLTGTGQVIGTVDFMAPEQAIETRSADARSDIYSLGVTLWYLIAGRPMFAGDSVVQRIMAHQQTPPPSLADVLPGACPRLDAVFQRMVAKRPEDRFQSMAELIAAIEALPHELQSSAAHGVDQSVPAPGVPPTSWPTWRRAAILVTALGAVAIAVAGLIRFDARRRPDASPARPEPLPRSTSGPADGQALAPAGTPNTIQDAAPSKVATKQTPGVVDTPPETPSVAPRIAIADAAALQRTFAAELGMPVETVTSIGATLVLIPSGRYRMGENQFSVDVTLSKPFLLGKTEITQGQWRAVMETEPWAGVPNTTEGDAVAATMITWDDAEEFCRRLTDRERAAGGLSADEAYRLPTEAEWEYACRAGTVTKFSFGGDDAPLGLHAWFGAGWDADNDLIPGGSSAGEQHAHDVGLKQPNPWGLHDVHGNVFEWVSDWYRDYPKTPLIDPTGPSKGGERVARGGSWAHTELFARSSYRARFRQTDRNAWIGFRLARSLPAATRAAGGGDTGPRVATSPMPAMGSTARAAAVAPFDAEQALRHQRAWAEHLGIPVGIIDSVGLSAVLVPPGTCTMGEGKSSVRVTLSQPFRIGQTEVTQAQWKKVMGTEPWKNKPLWDGRGYVTDGDDIPVTNVSWLDAATFCQRLTERARADGTLRADEEYRLPTEAEWEYACRSGTTTRYSFGDDEGPLGDHAWHGGGWDNDKRLPRPGGNTGDSMHAHAVMQKKPNPWGLHDMHGNVSEWCRDWFGPLPDDAATDPAGPPNGSTRVVRGGDWSGPAVSLSSSLRRSFPESFVGMAVGFRVVRTISHNTPADAVSPAPDPKPRAESRHDAADSR